jgi:hypothetical protein
MSSANVEVVFEGPAVKEGTIDARLLAESLLGYDEVFTRANSIINGHESTASVLVRSEFKGGSFIAGLEFVQNVTAQGAQLITAHKFLGAGALAGLIGFLPSELAREFVKDFTKETVLSLFRWLRGKKPEDVKPVSDEKLELKSGQEIRAVNVNVFNLYGDSAIREGLDRLTRPLRDAAIERIAVRQNDAEQAVFERAEAEIFEAEPVQLDPAFTEPMQGEREAVLVVSKLQFKEGSTWTFFERGAVVTAKIEDEGFWERVHKHQLLFGEGDLLRVRLVWEIQEKNHQVKQKNTIVRVLEKLERPKQLRFDVEDGAEKDRPLRKLKKRITLSEPGELR